MSDLRELLGKLTDDVDGLPRPSAAEVRAAARPRSVGRLLVSAVAAAGVIGSALAVVSARSDSSDLLEQGARPAAPTPGASSSPGDSSLTRAWLPPPWRHESSRAWPAGGSGHLQLCGTPIARASLDGVQVAQQVLAHPSGKRARLTRYATESPGAAAQLFKLTYSECLVPGRAEGVGGPRNLWSYQGVAGGSDFGSRGGSFPTGSELWGPVLHVAEISGGTAQGPVTRRDAVAVLDAWARSE